VQTVVFGIIQAYQVENTHKDFQIIVFELTLKHTSNIVAWFNAQFNGVTAPRVQRCYPQRATGISPNSTWLVTSRLDTTQHVRRIEPMHFGCVELV